MRPADLVAGSVLPMMAVPAAAVIGLLYWMWRRSQQLERRNKTAPQRPPRPRPPRVSLNELRGYFNNGLDDYNRATNAGEPTASEVRWMHESGLTSGVLPSPLFKACAHHSQLPAPPPSSLLFHEQPCDAIEPTVRSSQQPRRYRSDSDIHVVNACQIKASPFETSKHGYTYPCGGVRRVREPRPCPHLQQPSRRRVPVCIISLSA